ncbi:hypothetical protein [Spirilliplanes yamanashiensis]|uniref:Uncharacterized protein n=1 Tax=Spirilliplanes yamanashiensis TaxID=42233 RepID=A0A8J3YDK6_9ACTN|nr:hypothetical protein [Spirilliplanes yamanashiensis]MDP9816422.1 hypothetical protein [Spirilliplanes yamanashiensis]GIJ05949.1 hypothetical protein Sya03_53010 [Spirilliplanes yamanashiensis]
MPDRAQPWDRTVDLPPQDPWAHPPAPSAAPTSGAPAPGPQQPFSRGVAHVKPAMPKTESFTAEHQPVGTGWPDAEPPQVRRPVGWHLRQLRKGGEWSFAAAVFAFVGWGIWAISGGGNLLSPLVVFVLILAVAAGIFALARLLGRLLIERRLGRPRRTARGAHLVAAVFLVGVGLAYLRQTGWVMDAYGWVKDLFV